MNTLDLMSSPHIMLREATLSWYKLLYAERSTASRTLKVLLGADSGNIEPGGRAARPQVGKRRQVSKAGKRVGS